MARRARLLRFRWRRANQGFSQRTPRDPASRSCKIIFQRRSWISTGSLPALCRELPFRPPSPDKPLIAWGTGLKPVPGGDNVGSAGYDFLKNGASVQAIVGGMSITPAYAGRGPDARGSGPDRFHAALQRSHRLYGVVSNLGERGAEQSHLHRHRAGCQFECLCARRFHHIRIAAARSGWIPIPPAPLPSSPKRARAATPYASASGVFTQYTGFELATATSSSTSTTSTLGSCTVYTAHERPRHGGGLRLRGHCPPSMPVQSR